MEYKIPNTEGELILLMEKLSDRQLLELITLFIWGLQRGDYGVCEDGCNEDG